MTSTHRAPSTGCERSDCDSTCRRTVALTPPWARRALAHALPAKDLTPYGSAAATSTDTSDPDEDAA